MAGAGQPAAPFAAEARCGVYGLLTDQTPYRSGFIGESIGAVDGTPALVQRTVVSRQTDRGVTGIVSYPFSRAQRVEMSAAYRQLSFEDRVRTTAFSLLTGELLLDERRDLSDFPNLNLGQVGGVLVYDTTSFGATSPVLGQRYRAAVSPMFGSHGVEISVKASAISTSFQDVAPEL